MMFIRNAKKGPTALMVALFVAISGTAHAAGGEPRSAGPEDWQVDPAVKQLQAYVAKKDWQGGAAFMKTALERNPRSADYNSL